jgi:hypothetical protein
MSKIKQISDLERFYYEAKRIRSELDQLMKDMRSIIAIKPDEHTKKPVVIDPRTGKPF